MANSHTFRFGQRDPVRLPVDSAIVIEIGDACFYNTDDVRPASSFTWDTSLAVTQAAFADVFLGIAMEPSASGDTDPINVDRSGDSKYQFAVASATYEFGATLGMDKASGNALLSQTLEAAVKASSVAKAAERAPSAVTSLLVNFYPVYSPTANNAAGQVGSI